MYCEGRTAAYMYTISYNNQHGMTESCPYHTPSCERPTKSPEPQRYYCGCCGNEARRRLPYAHFMDAMYYLLHEPPRSVPVPDSSSFFCTLDILLLSGALDQKLREDHQEFDVLVGCKVASVIAARLASTSACLSASPSGVSTGFANVFLLFLALYSQETYHHSTHLSSSSFCSLCSFRAGPNTHTPK
jgi:hypothetical protein